MCAKVNAKLKSMEEECQSLRRALSVEVDGRRELECTISCIALVKMLVIKY